MSCLQCGGVLEDGAAFCQRCGAPVGLPPEGDSSLVCSGCGNRNPMGTNFCYACGRRLGHTTPMRADASAALAAAVAARPSVVADSQPGGPRLVAVRRDGSDGESYPLAGEQIDIGVRVCFATRDRSEETQMDEPSGPQLRGVRAQNR